MGWERNLEVLNCQDTQTQQQEEDAEDVGELGVCKGEKVSEEDGSTHDEEWQKSPQILWL
jgi:hypothetical protein